jgi:hypothetical protein
VKDQFDIFERLFDGGFIIQTRLHKIHRAADLFYILAMPRRKIVYDTHPRAAFVSAVAICEPMKPAPPVTNTVPESGIEFKS